MLLIILGALLFVGGILYLAGQAISRGRLSDPHPSPTAAGDTLEPRRLGMAFLGLGENWPGLLAMVIGAVLLLFGGFF